MVAPAASARRFVLQTAPLLVRALSAVGGATGRLAAATLLRDPSRTALSVATIAVGFGTVLWMWTLARSFERSVIEVMPGKLRGDLSVSSAHLDAGFIESPLDESILPGLRAVEGVAAVVGERAIDWEYAGGPIAIDALDRDYRVVVLSDGCADGDAALHAALIDRFFPTRGTVMTAREWAATVAAS